jgi:hypothetical protein
MAVDRRSDLERSAITSTPKIPRQVPPCVVWSGQITDSSGTLARFTVCFRFAVSDLYSPFGEFIAPAQHFQSAVLRHTNLNSVSQYPDLDRDRVVRRCTLRTHALGAPSTSWQGAS